MTQIAQLLSLADEFQRVEPIEDKTLSSRVFSDSKKLSALRDGADITTKRLDAAIGWFSDNWPDGAKWPTGVRRPKVAA